MIIKNTFTRASPKRQSYQFSEKLFCCNERSLGFNYAHRIIVFGWQHKAKLNWQQLEQKITRAQYLYPLPHPFTTLPHPYTQHDVTRKAYGKLKLVSIRRPSIFLHIFTNYYPLLVSTEAGETYRKLSEENIRLQAEVLQYKVLISFIIVFFSLTCFGDAKHAEGTLLP